MRYIARQSDNTVEPLQNGHLEDRRKWPMWRGSDYGEVGFFGWGGGGGGGGGGEYMLIVPGSCLLHPTMAAHS